MREEHVLTEQFTGQKGEVADWFASELRRELHTTHRLWLQNPAVARPILELGHYLRYRALGDRARELVILTVAQRHNTETAWTIHYPLALEAGASEAMLGEVKLGKIPSDLSPVERIVLESSHRLLEVTRLSDDEYARLKDAVGAEGVVDLVALTGFYVMLCMHIGTFDI